MEGKYIMCPACGVLNWTDFEFCQNCKTQLDLKDVKQEEDEKRIQRKKSFSYRINKLLTRQAS